jgi:adenosylcobyric acid synthase
MAAKWIALGARVNGFSSFIPIRIKIALDQKDAVERANGSRNLTMAALMIQGCGSDVGKSTLVAGLCRLFTDRGLTVRPFKSQNMSNNAAVTADGGEIGRAQALQALACRTPASVHMNPVLLKPQSDVGAQLIVRGKMRGTCTAVNYQERKAGLLDICVESFRQLEAESDLVLVEGAGSPAETNLRRGDIANIGFAIAADVPVVLTGDIDRGHVIAALVGAHAVLDDPDRAMIRGFLINKFRGDPSLFTDGRAEIVRRTGWRDLGMAPWLAAARRLPAEDAVVLDGAAVDNGQRIVKIAVPLLSRIANFDDFDPLQQEPSVDFTFIRPGTAFPGDVDLIVIPGTKSTLADLAMLRREGWDIDIVGHVRRGGRVLGLCGGYQMLGRRIADPMGVEGAVGEAPGLCLLDVETVLTSEKVLRPARGRVVSSSAVFEGYEMHVGRTEGPDTTRPFLMIEPSEPHGATTSNGRIAGGYVHGLFHHGEVRAKLLASFGESSTGVNHATSVEAALDEVATALEEAFDIAALSEIAGLPSQLNKGIFGFGT